MYFYSEMAWMWCVAGQWTTGHCVPPLAPDCGDIDVKIKEKEQGTVTTLLSNSHSSQRRDNRFTELTLKLKIRDKP